MNPQLQKLNYPVAPATGERLAAPCAAPAPDEPTAAVVPPFSASPVKALKRFARRRLFDLCLALNDCSSWIQRRLLRTTIPRTRTEENLNLPLQQMDQDLLGMYIRWNGHHVEKTVRYENTHAAFARLRQIY